MPRNRRDAALAAVRAAVQMPGAERLARLTAALSARRPVTAPAASDAALDAVRAAVRLPGAEHLARMAAVLVDPGAGAALALFAATPTLVLAWDAYARPGYYREAPAHGDLMRRVAAELARRQPEPAVVALASTHRDGYVRERAVLALAARPHLLPFLVLRTVDRVPQVRAAARVGLTRLLFEDGADRVAAALPMALAVARRRYSGFARAQVTAALLASPRPELADTGADRPRRFVVTLGLAHDWFDRADLVVRAGRDRDSVVRARAAEAACRQAVWAGDLATLRHLADSRRPETRALAVTGLVRAGRDEEATRFLDDPASAVRALARDAARRTGIGLGAHYRAAVAAEPPAVGAIAGLAEAIGPAAADRLRELLVHPDGQVRLAAMLSLCRLDLARPRDLVPLLRDPLPTVVRRAAIALRWFAPELGTLPVELLDDDRVVVRRAGYVLAHRQSVAAGLRAALTLAADPDAILAARARADLATFSRAGRRPRAWRADPEMSATDLVELRRRVARAESTLGADVARRLADRLG